MPKRVLIKKYDLLEVLNKNLKLHKEVYEETIKAFKENYLLELKKMSDDAATTYCKFKMSVNLSEPQNHEDDYTTAIQMIEADCRKEIELEFEEFTHFYLNKWEWLYSFRACYLSNQGYSGYSGISGYSSAAKEYFKM